MKIHFLDVSEETGTTTICVKYDIIIPQKGTTIYIDNKAYKVKDTIFSLYTNTCIEESITVHLLPIKY